MIMKHNNVKSLVLLPILLFLWSCSQPPEERVRELANQNIQAKMKGEWAVVYDLFYSKYKEQIPKKAFLRKPRGIIYRDYSIENVAIASDGKSATVKVISDFTMQGKNFDKSISIQRWVLEEDGNWYLVVKTFNDMFQPSHKHSK